MSVCGKRWRKATDLGKLVDVRRRGSNLTTHALALSAPFGCCRISPRLLPCSATACPQFYDAQVMADKVEARFPLLNEEEAAVMTQHAKKHKAMMSKVGGGSYDSTMTAFDFEREAAIMAVPSP